MNLKLTFIILSTSCILGSLAGSHDDPWCYKDSKCDARTWAGDCMTGKVQSPIDISRENIKENRTEIRLRFNKPYFDTQPKFYLKNNGHTIQVQLAEDMTSKLMIDGDGLKGSYVFSQFHFHWGSTDDKGSEHTVGGKSYPLELHLVHYNAEYKGLGAAVNSKSNRGLTVLGIFFKISERDNWALRPIIDAMSGGNVNEDLLTVNKGLNISAFLPENLSLFRYYGSLTTPGCFEIVHWNVFKDPVPISRAQLEAFRRVKDNHGAPLVDNFRPTLPLAGRKLVEYQIVQMEPKSDMSDSFKPMKDVDYEDFSKRVDPKTPGAKKGSAASVSANSLVFFGSICAIFSLYFKQF